MPDRFTKENKDKLVLVKLYNPISGFLHNWVLGFFLFQVVPVISPVLWIFIGVGLRLPVLLINIVLIFFVPVTFYFLYNIFIKFNEIKINTYEVKLKNINERFEFLFVSDFHIGKEFFATNKYRLNKIIELINSTNLGLIVFGGDFFQYKLEKDLVKLLTKITLPVKIGVYGNHDTYYLGKNAEYTYPEAVISEIESTGINILTDSEITTKNNSDTIIWGGTTDLYSKLFNLDRTFENTKNISGVKILISHNPDITDFVQDSDNIDLILCGHTHGSQIFFSNLLSLPMPVKNKAFRKGIFEIGKKTKIFISQGVGNSATRIRINNDFEIARIVLLPEKDKKD